MFNKLEPQMPWRSFKTSWKALQLDVTQGGAFNFIYSTARK